MDREGTAAVPSSAPLDSGGSRFMTRFFRRSNDGKLEVEIRRALRMPKDGMHCAVIKLQLSGLGLHGSKRSTP